MTPELSTAGRHPRAGHVVLLSGLGLIAAAALWLVITGNSNIRYSADHEGTVPMWARWLPALVAIAVIRLVPRAPDPRWPDPPAPYREAVPLLCSAIAFAAIMPLLDGEPAYTLLKLALLLGVPAAVFVVVRRRPRWHPGPAPADAAHRFGPAVPVAVWLVLSYATPLAAPAGDWARGLPLVELVATILVVFAVNALLEEFFYRRWLQTRWESLLGRWPAIVLVSLLWAVWHVAIQGGVRPDIDLATVIVSHAVTGLFLGYLWSRYRRMWPPLVIHGALNAMPTLLTL
ncbi:CPBP family intramembrane metalloprotease [Verrucosispora sp. ts21]|uniref:CPBP family intramembrane glutamic endopeptidase n=1 Tax=Verrucosispora sp. ts21 TaxID=2069341 RepID=UPI000C88B1B6|nr:CPBP family intramembrane glutamic endopeptidase [Verrucosispora sp. ts21]PMR58351.1 CPBP family intramembrane metalloprotease [Verrucosispora sp. ts21]